MYALPRPPRPPPGAPAPRPGPPCGGPAGACACPTAIDAASTNPHTAIRRTIVVSCLERLRRPPVRAARASRIVPPAMAPDGAVIHAPCYTAVMPAPAARAANQSQRVVLALREMLLKGEFRAGDRLTELGLVG